MSAPPFIRRISSTALLCFAWFCAVSYAHAESEEKNYSTAILPLLERYCYDCHADGLKKGGVTLDDHRDAASLLADRDLWQRIREQIDFRLMPPPDEDAPDDSERQKLLSWIDDAIFPVDPNNPDPGHVTLRRLNRNEYRNTIRDLLGVTVNVDDILPPDDSGFGFDNIGDALSLSPAHLERYFDAAETALDLAIQIGPMPRERQNAIGERLLGDGQPRDTGRFLSSNGMVTTDFKVPRSGLYRLEVTASGTLGGDAGPSMELHIGDQVLQTWEVTAKQSSPVVHAHEWKIEQDGKLDLSISFTNDFYDETIPDPTRRDRNLWVQRIELVGPLDGPPPPKPETHHRIFGKSRIASSKDPDANYAARIITAFAKRAFRRPVTKDELRRFHDLAMKMADGDIERGIRGAMVAILVSPSFIYREESGPVAGSPGSRSLISEFALASRLSYFLWGSMPDERLLDLAAKGQLRKNLRSETSRMLASEKSSSLVTDFVGQWLQTRDLDVITPDLKLFPQFDRSLAEDMRAETEHLVAHVIRKNLPLDTLLDADYTFLNERLAKHYGYPDISGEEFRKVPVASPRRGILGHASILTLTSYPTRTSPVIRGKYILDNILNTPPPPPTQNVPPLEANKEQAKNMPLRQQLEQHRSDPACSSCHALMDPLGFGLENFDAIGRWRDSENNHPIDPAGTLADGTSFAGPDELLKILREDKNDRFLRSATSKMLTYALGRGLEYYDRTAIDQIVSSAKKDERRVQTLIHSVIDSVPFQYRRNTP